MLYLAFLNIILSAYGVRGAYIKKSFILFVWMIIFYYSITSLVSLCDNPSIGYEAKFTYALNMTLCLLAFLASDHLLFKEERSSVDLSSIMSFRIVLIIVEVIYWCSLILTFVTLRTQNYEYYNSEGQAGWAQIVFQVASCIILYFCYQKQWIKIIISASLILGMISSTGVRSLIYFVALPAVFYFINNFIFVEKDQKVFFWKSISLILLVVIIAVIVDILRFGSFSLPETILTDISLNVLDNANYPPQLFNSLLHYVSGFTPPFINALNKLGLDIPLPSSFLLPSIPHLNDLYATQYDIDGGHMPATIFHDFYLSYGYYGAIWAFFVFSYLKILCNVFQRNFASFFAFSGVIGWHIYMLLRGACDGASSGISYSILLSVILYLFLIKYRIR